jgi:hypothetical protein
MPAVPGGPTAFSRAGPRGEGGTVRYRYKVYGRVYVIERSGDRWRVFHASNDGKRMPADFVIPDDIRADELGEFLEILFHEEASPYNGDVRLLP